MQRFIISILLLKLQFRCCVGMDNIIERFRILSSTTISDALDAVGVDGVLQDFRSVILNSTIVGRAFPVKEIYTGPKEQSFGVSNIIAKSSPGDVIVIANRGRTDVSTWGGITSTAAKIKGLAGTIIDGACRDIDEIRSIDFPVFARAWIPRTGRGRLATLSMGEPVQIQGLTVNPRDLILADATGIVVVPHELIEQVLSIAEKIYEKDKSIIQELKEGKDITTLY